MDDIAGIKMATTMLESVAAKEETVAVVDHTERIGG